jgi:hypothetical protein
MKLVLTSAGIKNTSIHNAMVDLLGKPVAESNALCIPTAMHAMPGGASAAWRFINGRLPTPLCELGWKSLGVLELTALHLDHEDLTDNCMANAGKWAASIPAPGYALDDQTAIKVIDGTVEIISEGHWKLFTGL